MVGLVSANNEILFGANGSLINPDESLDGPHSTLWIAGLRNTLSRLAALGTHIVIVDQPPSSHTGGIDPMTCIAARPTDFQQACRVSRAKVIEAHARAVGHRAAAGIQATFVDPADWRCDALRHARPSSTGSRSTAAPGVT